MRLPRHLVFGIGYVAAAVAVALLLPVAGFGKAAATALGAAVFLILAVAHDAKTRAETESRLESRLDIVRKAQDALVADVARLQEDVDVLRADVASLGPRAEDGMEARILQALVDRLTRATRTEPVPAPVPTEEYPEPETASAHPVRPFADMDDDTVLSALHNAVQSDRVDVFIQPVVSLPQRKLRFYETFSRVRLPDGRHLPGERYMSLAREAALIPAIDNLLLLRCIQIIRRPGSIPGYVGFFCNIAPSTLSDHGFMDELVQFLAENPSLAPRLVFEVTQKAFTGLAAEKEGILSSLARMGCRLSMDQVTDMAALDAEYLLSHNIRFVKVDVAHLLALRDSEDGDARLHALKSELDRRAIDLVVEKVETERALLEAMDYRLDLGQGFLFGQPEAYAEGG